MKSHRGRSALLALAGIFVWFALLGCEGIESSFTLAAESRLPRWIELPSGVQRSDVNVEVTYYTDGHVRVDVRSRSWRRELLESRNGQRRWHPVTAAELERRNRGGVYPNYDEITVDGITELFEQRAMEPKIYLLDSLPGDSPKE